MADFRGIGHLYVAADVRRQLTGADIGSVWQNEANALIIIPTNLIDLPNAMPDFLGEWSDSARFKANCRGIE